MDYSSRPFSGYNTGADFWRDNAVSHGIDEAVIICSRYLNMQFKVEISDSEKEFCREIFAAMYESAASRITPFKLVYPYDFKTANDRMETSCFHKIGI